jgi:hypothetical protein
VGAIAGRRTPLVADFLPSILSEDPDWVLEVLLTDPKGRCYEYWIAEDGGRERHERKEAGVFRPRAGTDSV